MDALTLESLGWLLSYAIVIGVIFLIIRQAVLWYFRINQMANNLQYIADHYRKVDGVQSVPSGQNRNVGRAPIPKVIAR